MATCRGLNFSISFGGHCKFSFSASNAMFSPGQIFSARSSSAGSRGPKKFALSRTLRRFDAEKRKHKDRHQEEMEKKRIGELPRGPDRSRGFVSVVRFSSSCQARGGLIANLIIKDARLPTCRNFEGDARSLERDAASA